MSAAYKYDEAVSAIAMIGMVVCVVLVIVSVAVSRIFPETLPIIMQLNLPH